MEPWALGNPSGNFGYLAYSTMRLELVLPNVLLVIDLGLSYRLRLMLRLRLQGTDRHIMGISPPLTIVATTNTKTPRVPGIAT